MQALPTLRQLQFLLALAQRQSFSKAADDCLVSQSTLSSAIKELEGLLQCQLVDRSTRAFGLTAAGEDAVERAARIIAQAEDLARAVADRQLFEGPFKLGVIPTIAPFLLPKVAPKLTETYPKLQLFLREDLTENLIERLASGALDAVLLALPYEAPGAETIEIGDDPFWFVAPPEHPMASLETISMEDLHHAELLLLEDGHCLRDHAIDACNLRTDSALSFGATSLLTLAEMVRSGLGVTLMPEMAVEAGWAKAYGLSAVPLADPASGRQIGLAWRRGSGRGEEVRAIGDILSEHLKFG